MIHRNNGDWSSLNNCTQVFEILIAEQLSCLFYIPEIRIFTFNKKCVVFNKLSFEGKNPPPAFATFFPMFFLTVNYDFLPVNVTLWGITVANANGACTHQIRYTMKMRVGF